MRDKTKNHADKRMDTRVMVEAAAIESVVRSRASADVGGVGGTFYTRRYTLAEIPGLRRSIVSRKSPCALPMVGQSSARSPIFDSPSFGTRAVACPRFDAAPGGPRPRNRWSGRWSCRRALGASDQRIAEVWPSTRSAWPTMVSSAGWSNPSPTNLPVARSTRGAATGIASRP